MWEPLIERVDNSKRRWNLELEVNITTADLIISTRDILFFLHFFIISNKARVSDAKNLS